MSGGWLGPIQKSNDPSATIASVIRTVVMFQSITVFHYDMTYNAYYVWIWVTVEINLAIACISRPYPSTSGSATRTVAQREIQQQRQRNVELQLYQRQHTQKPEQLRQFKQGRPAI